MSVLGEPTQVKFFFSTLYNHKKLLKDEVLSFFKDKDLVLKEFTPSFNPLFQYYSREMGEDLHRIVLYTESTYKRELLVDYKLWATRVEQENSIDNKRLVNIDVGYIAKEQVLLATGKPYSHRIYLNNGVYAELVYFFKEKSFQIVPWTYPDYQNPEKIEFFNKIR